MPEAVALIGSHNAAYFIPDVDVYQVCDSALGSPQFRGGLQHTLH